jgi:hypothetical protein
MTAVDTKFELERKELEWLLSPGVMGRSNNGARVLQFICDKYFNDAADQISEHSIAVEALARREDFDPQADTIVRVTVRALRKRLHEIYQSDAADHLVQVSIPAGHYLPCFVHRQTVPDHAVATPRTEFFVAELPASALPIPAPALHPVPVDEKSRWKGVRLATLVVLAAILAGVAGLILWKQTNSSRSSTQAVVPAPILQPAGGALRVLVGANRSLYSDQSGQQWVPDRYCNGGKPFEVEARRIAGTEDPAIFLGGIQGAFHCRFPVPPGTYEVHLLFAETNNVPDMTRRVIFSIDDGVSRNVDIDDDATGDNTATTRVFGGVKPERDGTIHLDFANEQSRLNAVEILPAPSGQGVPIRIVTGPISTRDLDGQVWLSDRYYFGGRRSRYAPKAIIRPILAFERIGHFRYVIPVDPTLRYDVKLYFIERWFGKENGGFGGVGSRIFDVSCNGSTLMKNFDLMGEGGVNPVVKVFKGIEPTAQGEIELTFTPVVDYPMINAIELIPSTVPPNKQRSTFDYSR